jgi:uncharacterized protein YktB (UPF0637 family)
MIGGENMYKNLLFAMNEKKITFTQISELLQCQLRTVSERCKGVVKTEFTVSEALLMKKVFFPEYDFNWLFDKVKLSA